MTAAGPRSFEIALGPIPFTVLLFVVGIAMAVGKASVFKFISDEFGQNIGAVSGIVGLAGGLGGFILPILFGVLLDLTGIRSSAFMLLYGTVCVSLIFMHFSFRPESAAIARRQPDSSSENPMSTHVLQRWEPENPGFWQQTGARIANRNLWISIPR